MSQIPTLLEMENCLANYFGIRQNIIVPNVSWGFGIHECDLLVVSQSNYATEIEIKRSKADLKKDISKTHGHQSKKIKYLWFAIPECLKGDVDLIPERAGVILVCHNERYGYRSSVFRQPTQNKEAVKLTDAELLALTRLGVMRIWGLKSSLIGARNDLKYFKDKAKC